MTRPRQLIIFLPELDHRSLLLTIFSKLFLNRGDGAAAARIGKYARAITSKREQGVTATGDDNGLKEIMSECNKEKSNLKQ